MMLSCRSSAVTRYHHFQSFGLDPGFLRERGGRRYLLGGKFVELFWSAVRRLDADREQAIGYVRQLQHPAHLAIQFVDDGARCLRGLAYQAFQES
jgi:hypothetical protein